MKGTSRHILALVEGSPLNSEKIGVPAYPYRDQDGYIWAYVPDSQGILEAIPDVPRLSFLSESYRLFHISTTLKCTIDNGIVGSWIPRMALRPSKSVVAEPEQHP